MSKRCSSETPSGGNDPFSRDRILQTVIVVAALAVAAIGARPFHGGANDGSRLATVEAVVDYHTLAIDRSHWFDAASNDKIRPARGGPYYSDKPPTLALMLAVPYLILHDGFGFRAAEHEAVFDYLCTFLSCGLAYVAAAWCVYRLGRVVGLSPGWAAGLTASFALATVALSYSRNLNSNLPTLAAAVAVMLNVAALRRLGCKDKDEEKPDSLHPSSFILHPSDSAASCSSVRWPASPTPWNSRPAACCSPPPRSPPPSACAGPRPSSGSSWPRCRGRRCTTPSSTPTPARSGRPTPTPPSSTIPDRCSTRTT